MPGSQPPWESLPQLNAARCSHGQVARPGFQGRNEGGGSALLDSRRLSTILLHSSKLSQAAIAHATFDCLARDLLPAKADLHFAK
eukprot:3486734-Pleurochrysis_carterae.AAC.5